MFVLLFWIHRACFGPAQIHRHILPEWISYYIPNKYRPQQQRRQQYETQQHR